MNPHEKSPVLPGRDGLEGMPREYILRGSWSKADVYIARGPEGPVVVKDFARKPRVIRWIGRLQISRECAAYAALEGVDGVARWFGRIDAFALALERVEGTPLSQFRKRPGREDLLGALRRILDAVHGRGVIHNDLRGRDNTLVRSDGRVVLIDFAGAFVFRIGGPWHRLLFGRLARVDEAAYLKWKTMLDPDSLTPEEEKFLRRFMFFRRFWIFNPKGAMRQP